MRALQNLPWDKVLFFDIETANGSKELLETDPMFDAWEYKMEKSKYFEQFGPDATAAETYADRAGLYPEFGQIVCISVGYITQDGLRVASFYGEEERTIIQDFYNAVTKFASAWGKVYLSGHYIKGFDVPYVVKRGLYNGIAPIHEFDTSGLKPWELDWMVDTKELWKMGGWDSASLVAIASAFGLQHSKDDISGAQVNGVFWDGGVERIARYCEKDVLVQCNVLRKMCLMDPVGLAQDPMANKGPLTRLALNPNDKAAMSTLIERLSGKKLTKNTELVLEAVLGDTTSIKEKLGNNA